MRILLALHDYLPRHAGGSEVHAHQSARELVRRGHRVSAVFTERDLEYPEGEVRRGELDGVETIEVVHQREYADVRETWEQAPALASFERALAETRPDVVHFHHLSLFGSGAVPAARRAGARVAVTLHDYHLLCDAATLLRGDRELCESGPAGECVDCIARHPTLSERWDGASRAQVLARAARERLERHRADLAAADVVVCPSSFLAGVFERAGFLERDRAVVLRYGYPGTLHPPRKRDPSRPLRAGYLGGIYPSKGLHVLVEAFRRLREDEAELHVHGHLDWFPDYVAGVRERARGRPVHLHGPYDPPRVDEVLAGLDVLVVPSIWYENMPLTIQEAFRNGLPVVATDLGGMAEALEGGSAGLLFPRGDDRALAACLRSLAADAELYDRLARARPEVPGIEPIVDRLEALYAGKPLS